MARLREIQAGVPKVSVLRYTVQRWLPPNTGIYLAFFADVYTYAADSIEGLCSQKTAAGSQVSETVMLALGQKKTQLWNTQAIYFYHEYRPVWNRLTKNGQTTEFVNLAKYLGVKDYMQKPYRYRLQNTMAVHFLLKREWIWTESISTLRKALVMPAMTYVNPACEFAV